MAICCENHLQCFFVAKKYLRIFARPDLIGKLRSEAAPQVNIACYTGTPETLELTYIAQRFTNCIKADINSVKYLRISIMP